jgi:nucleotide-binding universal stress UspA family protein
MNTIVIGYDASEAADRALERAIQFAKAFGSKLIVTSVARVMVPGPRGMGSHDPIDPPEFHAEQLRAAEERLTAEGLQAEYVNAIGDPARTIVEIAEGHGADLIIVGTREPGWLTRMVGESVSGSVTHKAHCDVLIVH